MPPTHVDDVLLAAYFSGDCTPAERQLVDQRAASDPGYARELEVARQLWSAPAAPDALDAYSQWDRLAARMKAIASPVPRAAVRWTGVAKRRENAFTPSWRLVVISLAAAVLLVAVSLWWIPSFHATQGHEYVTRAGQRLQVALIDGGQIMLAPESRVSVAGRTIDLQGEAYFSVHHDAHHPFSVHVNGQTVTDVGTRFDIRAYAGGEPMTVAVAEGEVEIGGRHLVANDVASITGTTIDIRQETGVSDLLIWMQDGLAFHATPLRDAVREVARSYDLEISIPDSLIAAQRITATFSHQSVDEILDFMTRAVGARYERTGRRVVVLKRTPSAGPDTPTLPALRTATAAPTTRQEETND